MKQEHKKEDLLHVSLSANCFFSGVSGLIFTIGHKISARFIDLEQSLFIFAIGVGLLIFSAGLYWVASKPKIHPAMALLIVAGDLSWVVATGILLTRYPDVLNEVGRNSAIAVALIVLVFADLQAYGLWHARKSQKLGL